tara:strand:- start:45 stop:680 length:636 start_codon:yes stop_codon:yes gene_type:complete
MNDNKENEIDKKDEAIEDKENKPETSVAESSEVKENNEEEDLESKISDLKDQLLRSLAENQNLRKRSKKEIEDANKYAITNFARDILTVSDNLKRALESSTKGEKNQTNELSSLVEGVELTEKELISIISRYGIKKIETDGEKFDAKYHQAMFEVETDELSPGSIVEVIQTGYTIGERLLRPAMVGVAKKVTDSNNNDDETLTGNKINTEV